MSGQALDLSPHAAARLRQRGLRERDLMLVLECGTPGKDAVLLTQKDVAREVATCRRRIAQLERLAGTAVFTAESVVVTVYRPDRKRTRRLLGRRPKLHRVRPSRGLRPRGRGNRSDGGSGNGKTEPLQVDLAARAP